MLPVEKDGECPKISQIEHGILAGLMKIFLGVPLGFAVPAGTVVIIFFASYMAAEGLVCKIFACFLHSLFMMICTVVFAVV